MHNIKLSEFSFIRNENEYPDLQDCRYNIKGLCCRVITNAPALAGEGQECKLPCLGVILSNICWHSPKVGISVPLQGGARLTTLQEHN